MIKTAATKFISWIEAMNPVGPGDTMCTALIALVAGVLGDFDLACFAIAFYEYELYGVGYNLPE